VIWNFLARIRKDSIPAHRRSGFRLAASGVCVVTVRRRKHEACDMTASKDGRQVALPDSDPIERAKKKRAEFIAALLHRFAVRLKSLFRASAHPTTSTRRGHRARTNLI
jgi:hypothetical protein